MDQLIRYLSRPSTGREVWQLFAQHLNLTATALGIALLLSLPLGLLVARWRRGGDAILGVLGVLYTIPSLALLVLLIPFLRLGFRLAVTVLVVYAQLILVRNIAVALRGMGMSAWQRLVQVELPLALPVIIAGIRIAALSTIAIATVATLVNAGGLGKLLFDGVNQSNYAKIYVGSFCIALLAIAIDQGLRLVERVASARR
jgi:osmoprotectant transport system permease protein